MTHRYRYGDATLVSTMRLTQLPLATAGNSERNIELVTRTDQVISRCDITHTEIAARFPPSTPWVEGSLIGCWESDRASFVFDQATQKLEMSFDPGLEPIECELLLLDWALPFIMASLGHLVLHATAVVINGAVVAFCGRPGLGKSTMAVALAKRGYPLAADDTLIIQAHSLVKAEKATVLPSYPGARLNPDSWEQLHGVEAPTKLHKITVSGDELTSTTEPTPLAAIFLLGTTDQYISIARAGVSDLPHLIEQSYRFEGTQSVEVTEGLLSLMDQGLVQRLDYKRDFDQLDMLLDAVIAASSPL